MINHKKVIELRLERQFLINKAQLAEYDRLYQDMQPGLNVYWNGFGDPPSLTFRADFNDIEYNRKRQANRILRKGRFAGGNLGWVLDSDFELYACLYNKPLDNPNEFQEVLYDLIRQEGPMNIQLMKEYTGLLVKQITPALHRLQKAFLIYEDQYDGEWDRGWYPITEIFPELNLNKYNQEEALKILIKRFTYRNVKIDLQMVKSYFKVTNKLIKKVLEDMTERGVLSFIEHNYYLSDDISIITEINSQKLEFVLSLHRNDFLVKSNELELKNKFSNQLHDTLSYLYIDGEFQGAVYGKFKYGANIIEDVEVALSQGESTKRKTEVINAIKYLFTASEVKRYNGKTNN